VHLFESIHVALDTLWGHKLRSFLTLLGIIVSIWTLVAVVSLVQGINAYVGQKIAGLGSNIISVQRYSIADETDQARFRVAQRRNTEVTLAEYEYLRDHASLASAVTANVGHTTGTVLKAGNHSMTDVLAQGVTANSIRVSSFDVLAGRYFTPGDETHNNPVAFIGADVANQLFPGTNPIGKTLTLDGHTFEVIGEATVQGNVFGQSQDNFLQIPLGLYRDQYGTRDSLNIDVKAQSSLLLPALHDQLEMLLRSIRHLKYQDQDNFGLVGADSLMALFKQLTGVIASVMIGIAMVFLVVGGIVIMNIMLAAVTERTREVGIRKALGARRKDILMQFLVESAILSTVGGLLGIALAYGFTLLAGAITPLPFSLPWLAAIAALVISTAVGLFFGIYPAQKAAKLEPIAALRAET
jgi:putative ABC transport system permease protein